MVVFFKSCPIKSQISNHYLNSEFRYKRVLKGSVSVNSSDSQCKDDNARFKKKKIFFRVLGLEEYLRAAKDMCCLGILEEFP